MSIMKIFVLLIFTFSSLVGQNISYNEEFQVNTYFKDTQNLSVANFLEKEDFVICWQSFGQDGNQVNVVFQIYNAFGLRKSQEILINLENQTIIQKPAIASFKNGRFVICYNDGWHNNIGSNIFFRFFNSTGETVGREVQITQADILRYMENAEVAVLSNDRFVVCWETAGEGDGSHVGIFGQIFDRYGNIIGEEFPVNTFTYDKQKDQKITPLKNGGFVICWYCASHPLDNGGIIAQIFNNSGIKVGTEFLVNSYTETEQRVPTISSLSDGGFVICWESYGQNDFWVGIYAQIFDELGNKRGAEFRINSLPESSPLRPSVSSLSKGGFVVCWEDPLPEKFRRDIVCKIFDSNTTVIGRETRISSLESQRFYAPVVSKNNKENFILSYTGRDDEHAGIFANILRKPISIELQNFKLSWPLNDITFEKTKIAFMWFQTNIIQKCYSWEITYDLYIDTDFSFKNPIIIKNIEDTTYTIDSLTVGKSYVWKVLAKNLGGDSLWSSNVNGFAIKPGATPVVEFGGEPTLQTSQLSQNYPNPFNEETEISYYLPAGKQNYPVKLMIYDLLGRLIKILELENKSPGHYSVVWDGTDDLGNAVPSGVYVYVLQVGDFKDTKKLVLMR